MKRDLNDENMIKRYLLGELPEQEQLRLEEQYFGNADVFEQFLVVEDQLIDDYCRGQLPRRERNRFEKYFLSSPRRRERVELARGLIDRLSKPTAAVAASPITRPETLAPRRSFSPSTPALRFGFRFSIALATLLVITGAAWMAFENARLRKQVQQLHVEQAEQRQREQVLQQQIAESKMRNDQLSEQLQRKQVYLDEVPYPLSPEPSVLSFVLTAGLQRDGGGMSRLVIPRHIRLLQIKINFEPKQDYMDYGVVLRKAEGDEILTLTKLRARSIASGKRLVLNLPSRLLNRGEYVLSLTGATASGSREGIEDYTFSVSRN